METKESRTGPGPPARRSREPREAEGLAGGPDTRHMPSKSVVHARGLLLSHHLPPCVQPWGPLALPHRSVMGRGELSARAGPPPGGGGGRVAGGGGLLLKPQGRVFTPLTWRAGGCLNTGFAPPMLDSILEIPLADGLQEGHFLPASIQALFLLLLPLISPSPLLPLPECGNSPHL